MNSSYNSAYSVMEYFQKYCFFFKFSELDQKKSCYSYKTFFGTIRISLIFHSIYFNEKISNLECSEWYAARQHRTSILRYPCIDFPHVNNQNCEQLYKNTIDKYTEDVSR